MNGPAYVDPQSSDKPLVVSACDQGYFPLVKGLFLSIIENDAARQLRLGFLDLGCNGESLDWLRSNGVIVEKPDERMPGGLADPRFGTARAQTCRPFLPRLFPDAKTIAWMDADMWVQDLDGVLAIIQGAQDQVEKVFAAPEIHFLYSGVNDITRRVEEVVSLNEAILGQDVAAEMGTIPVFNSGFFVASSDHALWEEWGRLVSEIYLSDLNIPGAMYHFAEQVAFNRVLHSLGCASAFDPLYNYLCIWSPPRRDSLGRVRLSAPPHAPVGVIHLAGGWRFCGRRYMRAKLLYGEGAYLGAEDVSALESASLQVRRYDSGPSSQP